MAPQRRGHRVSPTMDAELRHRERFTPSPPPPPLDPMVQPPRRIRRDRPSSPPPPPPAHVLQPRMSVDLKQKSSSSAPHPPPNFFLPRGVGVPSRGGIPQNMTAARPAGSRVVRPSFASTPFQDYVSTGGPPQMQHPSPDVRLPGLSSAQNVFSPPLPNNLPPSYGIRTKAKEQDTGNSFSNNTSSEVGPPPPPLVDSGSYPRSLPREIQTQPS